MATMQNIGVLTLLAQQRATSTATGADVNLANYVNTNGRQMKAILTIKPAGTDTDETCNVKIQESATTATGDFSDISGATFTQVTQESSATVEEIHFRTHKRYVRAIATLAGTTPAFDLSVVLLAEKRLT